MNGYVLVALFLSKKANKKKKQKKRKKCPPYFGRPGNLFYT